MIVWSIINENYGIICCVFFCEGTFFTNNNDILAKRTETDTFYTGRNSHVLKITATDKCIISYTPYTVGNCDTCEIFTITKRPISDNCNAFGKSYTYEIFTLMQETFQDKHSHSQDLYLLLVQRNRLRY